MPEDFEFEENTPQFFAEQSTREYINVDAKLQELVEQLPDTVVTRPGSGKIYIDQTVLYHNTSLGEFSPVYGVGVCKGEFRTYDNVFSFGSSTSGVSTFELPVEVNAGEEFFIVVKYPGASYEAYQTSAYIESFDPMLDYTITFAYAYDGHSAITQNTIVNHFDQNSFGTAELPHTGGPGAYAITLSGILMCLFAICVRRCYWHA